MEQMAAQGMRVAIVAVDQEGRAHKTLVIEAEVRQMVRETWAAPARVPAQATAPAPAPALTTVLALARQARQGLHQMAQALTGVTPTMVDRRVVRTTAELKTRRSV